MSIASEITRIQTAKSSLVTILTEKDITVPSGTKLEGLNTLIDENLVKPSGTLPITENGTGIDVTNYANVDVNVSTQKPEETFDVIPTIQDQIVTPTSGYVFSSGIVSSIYEEVDTAIELDTKLTDSNIGKMYKYTGTSGDGYYNDGLYIVEEAKQIGGRIFYVNPNVTGATYTFYDASGNILTDQTVSGLATAVTYTVTGTGSADKFYVFDNSTHTVSDGTTTYSATGGLVSSIRWGYYNITTGATANTIGSGKTNTSTVLSITDTSSYNTNTIWKYVKALNDNSFNGCNDWFVGNEAEQGQLRAVASTVGISWYSSNFIWSSVEYTSKLAYYWADSVSDWPAGEKSYTLYGFSMRAF